MNDRRPNVLFIMTDDLGYGDLGLFGNSAVNTPNLDALGHEGLVLTQHYSASPLCAPARAALLTGLYNHRTGAVDVPSNRGLDRIALSCKTMGDVFADAGYATGMIGKWHNGLHDLRHHPNARGFREFVGFLNGGMDYYRWVLDRNGVPEKSDGRYLTDVFTDEACSFIRRHREEPFFLMLTYNAPHEPLQAPEALVEKYRAAGGLSESVCRLYAMVEIMDRGVGRVMNELRSLGIDRNTIIIFTSDNGPCLNGDLARFNGPLRGGKGDVLEGGIRVPCIMHWPDGLPGGIRVDGLTHFCDWLPTLAALTDCNAGAHHQLDGCDITSMLSGQACDIMDTRYWQRNRYAPLPRCNGAMRDGPWKLVWPMRDGADWKDPADNAFYRAGLTEAHRLMPVCAEIPDRVVAPSGSPMLYRIDADSHEDHDVSAEYPQRLESMIKAWDAWFSDVTAGWRTTYEGNAREHVE